MFPTSESSTSVYIDLTKKWGPPVKTFDGYDEEHNSNYLTYGIENYHLAFKYKDSETLEFFTIESMLPNSQMNNIIPKNVKVGDRFVDLQVVTINERPSGINADKDNVFIQFSGQVEVTGTFKYHGKNDEFFANSITFLPDSVSAVKIPMIQTAQNKIRPPFFIVKLQNEEDKKQFSPQESEGMATIVISNYNINYAATEIWDSATLIKITNIKRFNVALLPDGKLIYPNQEPVLWSDLKVKIINNGAGLSKEATLEKLIRSQMAPPDEFIIIQQEQINLSKGSAVLALIQRKTNNPAYEFFVIVTKQHASIKELNLVYAITAEYSGVAIEDAKKQVIHLAETWIPPTNAWFPERSS